MRGVAPAVTPAEAVADGTLVVCTGTLTRRKPEQRVVSLTELAPLVSRELACGFYGQGNFYIVSHLMMPNYRLDRRAAGRIVDLFLAGAGSKKRKGKS